MTVGCVEASGDSEDSVGWRWLRKDQQAARLALLVTE